MSITVSVTGTEDGIAETRPSQSKSQESAVVEVMMENEDEITKKKEVLRWDLIYLAYFVAGFLFSAVMGMSPDYNHVVFSFTYGHWATEGIVAFHMLYTPRTARILSILSLIMYGGEVLFMVPFVSVETVQSVFYVHFILSDLMSALSAFCLMMNLSASQQMRNCAFAILLHFVGISLSLARLPIMYFDEENLMHRGETWVLLATASCFQLYFLSDALRSKCNYRRFSFSIWTKIAIPAICVLTVIVYGVLAMYRTTEKVTDMQIGSSIWGDIAIWTFWPVGVGGIIIAVKMHSDGRAALNKKL